MSILIKNLNGKVPWNQNDFINVEFSQIQRINYYSQFIKNIDILESENQNDELTCRDISLINRIGSESQNGEVYTNEISNSVIKILPISTMNSYELNTKEIEIASRASQLVLEGISSHFPIVYEFGHCQKFIGYNHQNIECHFLISERASCDLETFLNRKRSEYLNRKKLDNSLKQNIKTQCLKAISDLHKYLGVCHNDLHLRNFLIMENEQGEILVLIHDFGAAEYRTTYQNLDYEFFETSFSEFWHNKK